MKYSALIGNPVDHSISDFSFGILSNMLGIDYSHLKIQVNNKADLKKICDSMINLNFVGFNITCPYKLDIYNLIDTDKMSEEALNTTSINSVVIRDGNMYAYNTDGKAAVNSITHFYKIRPEDKIVLLGAGGAAHSILYELYKFNQNIVIFNKERDEALKMVNTLNVKCKCYSLSDRTSFEKYIINSNIIVNATSVGMYPNDGSLISEEYFRKTKKKVVFDAIFNPYYTDMLRFAKRHHHLVISGMYMLVYQAIYVLELWLNIKINLTKKQVEQIVKELKKYEEEKYS